MVLAFSGHRPERLPWGADESDPRCQALRTTLGVMIRKAAQSGYDRFLCGMARGCDFFFAEEVLRLQNDRPGLSLAAVLPCRSQPDGWRSGDRERYRRLCDACGEVLLLEEEYTRGCMLRRNRWMVEHADALLTVYDGGGGGTGQTVRCAERAGVPVWPVWL